MRDSLEEERRAAIVKRIECELELGQHADLVGELRHLLAQYPLDEAFIAHQMTALYGSGRPGEALSLYRDVRDRLIEELGTEPGPWLSELHQRILQHDPQLAVRPASPRQGRISPPDTLPPETTEFVGRSEELELLTGEPGDTPWVNVIEGTAGVGKTALALQAARAVSAQYPDGTFYLNLHTHDPGHPSLDAGEALHRLLRMLTAPAAQIPDAPGERAALLRAQLSRRRAILILDDAGRHDQIRPLLPETGECLILITTRRTFPGLEGARALTLDACPWTTRSRCSGRWRDRVHPTMTGKPPWPSSCADGCRSPSSSPRAGSRGTTRPGSGTWSRNCRNPPPGQARARPARK